MRLNKEEIAAIKKAVAKNFGPSARVYLFGSRTDNAKRGGDIDLLVEHDPSLEGTDLITKKLTTMSDIQFSIGDQKIDIVTSPFRKTDADGYDGTLQTPLIVENARKEGIRL